MTVWDGTVINAAPLGLLAHALQYADRGMAVLPLNYVDAKGNCSCGKASCKKSRSEGKHPLGLLVAHGVSDATKDKSTIRAWWGKYPSANIGIACGEISGIVVVDVDPRNFGDDTLSIAEAKNGKLPDTAMALTGGGGQHYLFRYPVGKKLKSPGKGVDIQSDGKFIVAAPSVHKSGKKYEWESESDLLLGFRIAEIPPWFIAGDKIASPGNPTQSPSAAFGSGHMPQERQADCRAALAYWDVDNYDQWIKAGQALHSTDTAEAFAIWDTWSRNGKNYQKDVSAKKWLTFNSGGGIHIETIFAVAHNAGWNCFSTFIAKELPIELAEPESAPMVKPAGQGGASWLLDDSGPPSHLLMLPGALGDLVTEINRTAAKCQPQFAILTALAIGSVVMSRRYRTEMANFTNGYFLALGESGCGKEYIRSVTQKSLRAAGMQSLLGAGGYTSDSAILSELLDRPAHIAISDEFGDLMELSAANLNQHKAGVLKMLKELWGLADGEYMATAMSRRGLTKDQKAKRQNENVLHPSLTLVGLSTAAAFYEGISEKAITGGFLNRINIVETNIPKSKARLMVAEFVTPESFIVWCKATREAVDGNMAAFEHGPDSIPPLRVIHIDIQARAVFDALDDWQMEQGTAHEDRGLGEIFARVVEKALRLSAVLAGSVDPLQPVITAPLAQWAADYVQFYTLQACQSITSRMHGGKFGKWCAEVLRVVQSQGNRGASERELYRHSRTLKELDKRSLDSVLLTLRARGVIELYKSSPIRGPRREAWRMVPDAEE